MNVYFGFEQDYVKTNVTFNEVNEDYPISLTFDDADNLIVIRFKDSIEFDNYIANLKQLKELFDKFMNSE